MIERLPYIAFILDLLLTVMAAVPMFNVLSPLMAPNLSWFHRITGFVLIVLIIILIGLLIYLCVVVPIVGIALFVELIFSLVSKRFIRGRTELTTDKRKAPLRRFLRLFLREEDEENIAGDLLEEFYEFDSRLSAYFWLYKQVLKSALPLIYENVASRLASYFGKRIR